ncbi:MAG: NAD-dependent succinate-semialdehyde dehydrogenase [Saprospiraceae bacterium]|nr:NAD-dependent succinate-semialdehyde dehydrogenase [Saprospiraceae bacterium]MDZ4702341.1 NAD-dependent succinate-semialdehyde dehydrogenase [Saprospiraceae bacterium]
MTATPEPVFQSMYPYTGEVINSYPIMNRRDIVERAERAEKMFAYWRQQPLQERAGYFQHLATLLRENADKLATLITREMGKHISEAHAEIEKCAWTCAYFAKEGPAMLHEISVPTEYSNKIVFEPVGAVLAVMPWNFPFWQVFRYAVPALLAGNVTMLKHAPSVCGCALAIEDLFRKAGFPEGVFQVLIIEVADVEFAIRQPVVQGITLTGSETAGSKVASIAGRYIKKTVLELGGSDPVIVLEDADVEKAAKVAVQSRMMNAGQSCICGKRFLITRHNADAFIAAVLEEVKKINQGDPFSPQIQMGPMARIDLADNLERQMRRSMERGATVAWGGERSGCNFQPTLLLNGQVNMPVFNEETFGPLAAIFVSRTENELIKRANATNYGLGASIWSKDTERAELIARKIEAGAVFINAMVKSDPRLPFGGIKLSGYGRELSEIGMKEFCNIKTISTAI